MARSSYVYIFTWDGPPIAAFTVKHEAVWWYNNSHPNGRIRFYRVRDGGDSHFTELPLPGSEVGS